MFLKNSPIVVDTSVAVKWISQENEPLLPQAQLLLTDMRKKGLELFMPELAKYEVGNALRYKRISPEQSRTALESFYRIPIEFIADDDQTALQILGLAQQNDITYYDAVFISLAKRLRAPLVTANPKHHQRYTGKDIEIIPLERYR